MKKLYKASVPIITIVCLMILYACNYNERSTVPVQKKTETDSISSTLTDSQKVATDVLMANRQVLTAIKNKDYKTFATFIHPVTGIRFSPNAYLDPVADQTLSVAQFSDLTTKNWRQQLVWETGMDGDSIQLTVGRYFEKYLNDVDFSKASQVAFNKIVRSEIDDKVMKAAYGKYPFVDNYFPGFETKYGGLDWRSLRLVFDKYDGKYFLVGIINDQYEI